MFAYRLSLFFFFNDTATTEIYTLSLHDALPIFGLEGIDDLLVKYTRRKGINTDGLELLPEGDRKSTRLNSSHSQISYAVFCLKKKKTSRLYADKPLTEHNLVPHTLHTRRHLRRT